MKSRDVLERIVVLMKKGRVSEETGHHLLNGATINKTHTYKNGMLYNNATGRLEAASLDTIWNVDVDISDVKSCQKNLSPQTPSEGQMEGLTDPSE